MTQYIVRLGNRDYRLDPRGLRIGRAPDNTVVLSDPTVSSHHAVLYLRDGTVMLQDLGSTNGTFVNKAAVRHEQPLRVGDVIQVGASTLVLISETGGPGDSTPWRLAGILVAGAVTFTAFLILLASRDSRTPVPRALALPSSAAVPTASTPLVSPSTLERARLAAVQVVGTIGGGSGSVVDSRGYILTNYHVVAQEPVLLIGVNRVAQDAPPVLAYQAEVESFDVDLDLALLRITADERGRPLAAAVNLVSLPVGNSDQVQLGDSIDILGFPDVGGATVTLTKGTVAGFIRDDSGRNRGWIKTDAEISPGNSGGVAINQAGELIGVPSLVSAEDRTLGRIGVLRPINLAKTLLLRIPSTP